MENRTNTDSSSWYFLPTAVTVVPLGIPTNALVIHVLLGKSRVCSTSEIFTLNLAMINLLFCILFITEYLLLLFRRPPDPPRFISWGIIQGGGPLLLCLLSLDSYVAVCHPLLYIRLKDHKIRPSLCLVALFMSATCAGFTKSRDTDTWFVLITLLLGGMMVTSICSILIAKSLLLPGPGKKGVHPMKKRAFKIVLMACVLVNIHYLPPVAEYLLKLWVPNVFKPTSLLTPFSHLFLSTSSFSQALNYLIRTKQLLKISFYHSPN